MSHAFYFDRLYPCQDRVLATVAGADDGFYLTGGTAASRGYLQHRFSDDLDLFVNDDAQFALRCTRVIEALTGLPAAQTEVVQRDERFLRLVVTQDDVALRVEMVNDVPAHVGAIRQHPVLGRLDSPENILANKLSALVDREEPKDLADVWGFCCRLGVSVERAITDAQSKAAGIFPVDLGRILLTAVHDDWAVVRWIEAPDPAHYLDDLHRLGEQLLLVGPVG
jgi:hypothetical protein